jgi:uncharacterized RDD family membrane protein YckC
MQIHIAKNGQKMGPYSEAQVREMLAAGSIAGTDLAWHEGLADWKPLASVLSAANAPAAPVSTAPVSTAPVSTIVPGVAVIDPNLAERGTRLGAVLLDCLALTICLLPGFVVLLAGGDDNDTTKAIGGLLMGVFFLALAIVQIYMLTTRGQSIGKRIVGVKIVKYVDNSSPGFVHACLLRAIVPSMIGGIPFAGSIFWLVDICFIFGEERRCLHDLIAGTKVVKA